MNIHLLPVAAALTIPNIIVKASQQNDLLSCTIAVYAVFTNEYVYLSEEATNIHTLHGCTVHVHASAESSARARQIEHELHL